MVKLAVQLVDRQTGRYDPADTEDHYEARLRAMIDAKLAGEGIRQDDEVEEPASNVIDLMAALKKSLGTESSAKAAKAAAKPNLAKPTPAKTPKRQTSPQPSAKTSRKRA
jgi:DNA end-binding protein Ku